MPTITKTFTPLLGKMMRVVNLDNCGNRPATATPDSILATNGFVTVTLSAEVEDGAEIITKKADGSLCVNEKFAASFKRFTVAMEFCGVNPSLLSMVSNAKPYLDYSGNVAGFTVGSGLITDNFSLEVWTGIAGAACQPGAAFYGGYMLLPFVAGGVVGDISVAGDNATNFSLSGAYTRGGNQWGVGPFNVVLNPALGTSEVQTVTITGAPTGGTFTLTYNGQTTAAIPYNATSAQVATALQALSGIGASGVTTSGGPLPTTAVTVTFAGSLAKQNVNQMTASGTGLTGGTTPAVAVTTTTGGIAGVGAPLPTPVDTYDHLLMMDTGLAPPPSADAPLIMV